MSTTASFPSTDTGTVSTAELAAFVERLSRLDGNVSDGERVEQLGLLETLKATAAAGQARVSVAFDASQRSAQAAAGVPAAKRGVGVASQIALARRESPNTGGRHLGLAKALVHEMPYTLAALGAGRLNEWRATLLVRETAHLSVEHRMIVDEQLCADATVLDGVGDTGIVMRAKKLAYRLDPASAVKRAAKAAADRRVTIRPAPDTMAYVTGLLPVAAGVAVHAALTSHADACKAQGDPRTRAQIMADAFHERLTGKSAASGASIELQLVMTDVSVFGPTRESSDTEGSNASSPHRRDGSDPVDEPAQLLGGGGIPAAVARQLLRDADRVWVRRLFRRPGAGELVSMTSRRRFFAKQLRRQIIIRDQTCRTPWCDAPIRHGDHVVPHEEGGPSSELNAQGLCEACNYAKQAPGWRHVANRVDGRHRVDIITPTGASYRSHAPPLPGHDLDTAVDSSIERLFRTYVEHAS